MYRIMFLDTGTFACKDKAGRLFLIAFVGNISEYKTKDKAHMALHKWLGNTGREITYIDPVSRTLYKELLTKERFIVIETA